MIIDADARRRRGPGRRHRGAGRRADAAGRCCWSARTCRPPWCARCCGCRAPTCWRRRSPTSSTWRASPRLLAEPAPAAPGPSPANRPLLGRHRRGRRLRAPPPSPSRSPRRSGRAARQGPRVCLVDLNLADGAAAAYLGANADHAAGRPRPGAPTASTPSMLRRLRHPGRPASSTCWPAPRDPTAFDQRRRASRCCACWRSPARATTG